MSKSNFIPKSRTDKLNAKLKDSDLKGMRDISLYAYIRSGVGKNKQEAVRSTLIKDATTENITEIVQKYTNTLCREYGKLWDYDEDEIYVDVKDSLGWTGASVECEGRSNNGTDDDTYSIGYK
jgi:hypothetical protein